MDANKLLVTQEMPRERDSCHQWNFLLLLPLAVTAVVVRSHLLRPCLNYLAPLLRLKVHPPTLARWEDLHASMQREGRCCCNAIPKLLPLNYLSERTILILFIQASSVQLSSPSSSALQSPDRLAPLAFWPPCPRGPASQRWQGPSLHRQTYAYDTVRSPSGTGP